MIKKNRKFIVKNRRKRNLLLILFVVLFCMIGIGYSSLSTMLHIGGTLTVNKYFVPSLYNVFKAAAEEGVYALEYTGNHHDSYTEEPSQKIYYWTNDLHVDYSSIIDMYNVIFAGYCWQMMRTTDTGGVKLVYNGEVDDNKCLSNRPTHSGFSLRASKDLAGNYWYGTDYIYDSNLKKYKVSGTTEQVRWSESTSSDLIGKYTCALTDVDGTCSTLYYIESYYDNNDAYTIQLQTNAYYASIGTIQYNIPNSSLASAGYMYNTKYNQYVKDYTLHETMNSISPFSSNSWFADSVTWGSPVANVYNLNNPYQVSSISDSSMILGKYTFINQNQTYTRSNVYYVTNINGNQLIYIPLSSLGNHTLEDYNYKYTYGDSYTDNGNGTYTINNPSVIERINWYTDYNNVNHKYVCKGAVNNTCSDLWYVVTVSNSEMNYVNFNNMYKYSKNFTWDGSKYVLDSNTEVTLWNVADTTELAKLNNAHYTCLNLTGECEKLYYIYEKGDYRLTFLVLENGKSIEDALNEMLFDDNVNVKDSLIKKAIDLWYERNMLDYSDYLEDTIWCANRSIQNLNVWNPNGGEINKSLKFRLDTGLSCLNETDQFSVSNNKAKLKYKVGLLRGEEIDLFGHMPIFYTGQQYWVNSPAGGPYVYGTVIGQANSIGYLSYSSGYGIRPAISLKPGTLYSSGDGSRTNPYVVDTN